MKQFIALIFATMHMAAFSQGKNYATIEFKVDNPGINYLNIKQDNVILTTFNLDSKGFAKDSITIDNNPFFEITNDFNTKVTLFLKSGYGLKVFYDDNNPIQTINFAGEGSENNNFLANFIRSEMAFNYSALFTLDKISFQKELEKHIVEQYNSFNGKNIDIELVNGIRGSIERSYKDAVAYYKSNNAVKTPAPPFEYTNYKGGKSKLSDFKGKYVYIDFWATWCGPCMAEVPYFKEVEKNYSGKNIVFVGISIDDVGSFERWKKVIAAKQMSGEQLFAGQGSAFVSHFNVSTIPRFLLIDPDGMVIDEDAPRPSDPRLREMLNSLLK